MEAHLGVRWVEFATATSGIRQIVSYEGGAHRVVSGRIEVIAQRVAELLGTPVVAAAPNTVTPTPVPDTQRGKARHHPRLRRGHRFRRLRPRAFAQRRAADCFCSATGARPFIVSTPDSDGWYCPGAGGAGSTRHLGVWIAAAHRQDDRQTA
jgi:hypothetical protein